MMRLHDDTSRGSGEEGGWIGAGLTGKTAAMLLRNNVTASCWLAQRVPAGRGRAESWKLPHLTACSAAALTHL